MVYIKPQVHYVLGKHSIKLNWNLCFILVDATIAKESSSDSDIEYKVELKSLKFIANSYK